MKNCEILAVGIVVGIAISNCVCKEKPKPPKLPCKKDIECDCIEKPKPHKKCYYQRYYR